MGHLNRFQRRLLPYTNTGTIQEISEIPCGGPDKALPFGLSMAPLEFTVIVKEVKLMAMHQGIRIHQYLDDWLVRARSHQACLQHTQDLVALCQKLGWLVNLEKSELEPKQIFDFIALIHPIQWTIAKPVGADRPAKRQAGPSTVHSPGGAWYLLPV